MNDDRVIGLDIGGANIKLVSDDGKVQSVPFALWKSPERLSHLLAALIQAAGGRTILVTMTAELCDCFRTKREGVLHVLAATEEAAWERKVSPERIFVWSLEGKFLPLQVARVRPLDVAAANWLATATWIATLYPRETVILIDVGSTTTDITLLRDGFPVPLGKTDSERLLARELVYIGVRRTPIPAVVSTVPYRHSMCPVMAELFATSLDVFLLSGELCERPDDCNTADGRPATREGAIARITRVVGADVESMKPEEAATIALHVRDAMLDRLAAALSTHVRRAGKLDRFVIAGEGEFLARNVARRVLAEVPVSPLSELAGDMASRAACACALLQLWEHQQTAAT